MYTWQAHKKLAGKIVQSTKASNWSVVLSEFLGCFKPLPDDLVPFCFFPITNLVSESLKLAGLRIFFLAVLSMNESQQSYLENLDSFRYFLRLYWLLPSALKLLGEWSVSIIKETGTPWMDLRSLWTVSFCISFNVYYLFIFI